MRPPLILIPLGLLAAALAVGPQAARKTAARAGDGRRAPRGNLPAHCTAIVERQLYACPSGRAYARGDRGWHDVGPVHPVTIRVPALLER
jgi:hypothetical protein